MPVDKMTIEILADGTIKTSTDAISGASHDNAESFLRNMAKLAGGTVKRMMRTDIPRNLLTRLLREHAADGHVHNHNELDTHSH